MKDNIENKIINTASEPETFMEKLKNKLKKDKIDYFEMFVVGASISLEAAQTLKVAFKDEVINKESLRHIKEIEHKGDKHMHQSLKIIEIAFITPIDQSDLMEILEGIENITDSIDAIAIHIDILNVDKRDDFMKEFIDIIVVACEKIHDLMVAFKKFKDNPNNNINDLIVQINILEGNGDKTYAKSIRHLFEIETDILTIIKKKEIYHRLEETLDCCEDVADLIERIMVRES